MKTFIKSLLAVVLLLTCSMAEARARLAVRAFEDRTEEGDAPAAAVMDMMVTELDKAGVFDLIERERLDYVMEEIRLGQSGLMDPETAPEVGKIVGAQYTMTGAITLYHYSEKAGGIVLPIIGGAAEAKTAYVVLEIRIIDNSTGRIVYTADQQGKAKREMKGFGAAYKGFYVGSFKRTYGGILGTATRDAVLKHVAAIKGYVWE